jgi:serine/threonine-protein kinase
MARLDGPHGFERVLALKLVHEHLLPDRDFVAMFLDEATLASKLQHPNIVHSYELCQDDDALYLAMEYLQGQPLSRLYQRSRAANQPLPYSLVAWLVARAADALSYAHAAIDTDGEPLGVVHRDVSPDNLFTTYDGQVKLLDFGIARAARRLAQTDLGQIKGKLRYMAPEYALGQPFDGAVDVFALGATLYEAAVGVPAYGGEEQAVIERIVLGKVLDPREIRADFPAPLWAIIEQMLAPKAEQRLTAAAAARALDEFAGLTAAQGRALLSLTLERVFHEDRAGEAQDLTELRRLSRTQDDRTEHGHVVSGGAIRPSAGGLRFAVIAGVAVLAVLGLLLTAERASSTRAPAARVREQPTSPSPPVETVPSVDIAVQVAPAGIASVQIEIGGVSVPADAAHRAVLRSSTPTAVHVSAPGYRPVLTDVIPERDHALTVTLSPAAQAQSAPVPRPGPRKKTQPEALAAPEGVIKRYPF